MPPLSIILIIAREPDHPGHSRINTHTRVLVHIGEVSTRGHCCNRARNAPVTSAVGTLETNTSRDYYARTNKVRGCGWWKPDCSPTRTRPTCIGLGGNIVPV